MQIICCLPVDNVQDAINSGTSLTLSNKHSGYAKFYITVDFEAPLHGYPVLNITDFSTHGGVVFDLGYTEKQFDQYSGATYVDEKGWLNSIGIVGQGD
jgi:hypothetical protein